MSSNNRVLIIDDNTLIRSSASTLLKKNGLAPHLASNGLEGLVAVRDKDPGLVVLDLDMPEMNGFEMLSMLRGNEATEKVPVLILTGLEIGRDQLMNLTRLGIQGVIKKPFKSDELVKRVKRILSDQASDASAPEPKSAEN